MVLSITAIIFLSFSSILINSVDLYEKEINNRTSIQKILLLQTWLANRIEESSSTYVSSHDNKLTFKEKGSNKLYKLVLYQSKDKPAVGIEKYRFEDNILRYIEKEPIINGVVDLIFENLRNEINNKQEIKAELLLEDEKYYHKFILN